MFKDWIAHIYLIFRIFESEFDIELLARRPGRAGLANAQPNSQDLRFGLALNHQLFQGHTVLLMGFDWL